MEVQEYDVVVVGCGISGISAAYHLSKNCPWAKFIVLERRSDLGGTWSLFKYPGIRSDSDMFTFGFGWRPWTNNKIISPKEQILEYLNGAVDDENLRQYIKFDHNVLSASFSSQEQTWTLQVENGVTIRSSYVMFNTGYYQYENPYTPEFPGKENFSGLVVHPQLWPSDLDYSNKKVVVIGSGATAATLVPAMAEAGAAKVTMLQRSPSYFVSRDNDGDWFYSFWSTLFGDSVAHRMNRLRYIIYGQLMFESAQALPSLARAAVIKQMRDQCPQDFDVDTHFSPKYGVWDQRVCLIPDGDFFLALHDGKVDIVTDNIDEFVETGIRTESGNIIEADIIVSATGLNLQENLPMSTIKVDVDGKPYNAPDHFIYRGCMLSGVPNFVFTLGYSNAGWTLKSDLISKYMCDLINHCKLKKLGGFCPNAAGVKENMDRNIFGDFSSGYLLRAKERMPKQGMSQPWLQSHNVLMDYWRYKVMPYGKELEFQPKLVTKDGGNKRSVAVSRL